MFAERSHAYIKNFVDSCQSSVDYGNVNKNDSLYCRLGRVAVAAGIPFESNQNFPWEKPQSDSKSCNEKKKVTM